MDIFVPEKIDLVIGALETRGRVFATVDEDLKSNGNDKVDIEKLSFNGGTQTHRRIQIHQPFKNRAASLFCLVADSDVDQPTQQIHTSSQFQRVNRACLRLLRRRRTRRRRRWNHRRWLHWHWRTRHRHIRRRRGWRWVYHRRRRRRWIHYWGLDVRGRRFDGGWFWDIGGGGFTVGGFGT